MVKGVSYRVIEKKRGNSEVFLLASLPNEKWYKRYLWQSFMLWVKLQLDTKEAPSKKREWWYMILFFAHYPKEFNFIHGGNLLFWWPSSQLKLVQLLLLNLKVLGQLGLWPDTAWKNIAESISSWVFLFFFVLHCGTLNKVSWAQNSRTTLWCLLLTGVHLCN